MREMAPPRMLSMLMMLAFMFSHHVPAVAAAESRLSQAKKKQHLSSTPEAAEEDVAEDGKESDVTDQAEKALKEAEQQHQKGSIAKEMESMRKEDDPQEKEPDEKDKQKQKKIDDIQAKLSANLAERSQIEIKLEVNMDLKTYSKKIADAQKRIGSEVGPAMANMLGNMYKELRKFEMPSYPKHTAAQLESLKKVGQALQAELAEAKFADAEEADAPKMSAIQVKPGSVHHGTSAFGAVASVAGFAKVATPPPPAPSFRARPPPRSQWSFWAWPSAEQRTSYVGTAVYVCFGLVFAFLYNNARSHAKALLPQRDYRNFPNPEGFTFGLFDCFSDANICIIGCCCPCLRWADTLDRQGILPYWQSFLAMFALMALNVYSFFLSTLAISVLGVVYRRRLYQHYNIAHKAVALDCFAWLCCQPCAIIQEAREASVARSEV